MVGCRLPWETMSTRRRTRLSHGYGKEIPVSYFSFSMWISLINRDMLTIKTSISLAIRCAMRPLVGCTFLSPFEVNTFT